MKITKIIKGIAYTILTLLLAGVVVFGTTSTKRGKAVRTLKSELAAVTAERDSLQRVSHKLATQPAIVCTVQFDLRNNAVFGVNNVQAQQVAEQVAVYTREEMLAIIDSLNNAR